VPLVSDIRINLGKVIGGFRRLLAIKLNPAKVHNKPDNHNRTFPSEAIDQGKNHDLRSSKQILTGIYILRAEKVYPKKILPPFHMLFNLEYL